MQVVGWLGWIGAMTGVSSQGYSISLNFRKADGSLLPHIIKGITSKKALITFTVRDLLLSQLPFEQFVDGLLKADFLAPCYLTVASMDSGVVISRGKKVDIPLRRLPPLTRPGEPAPQLPTNTISNERFSALIQTNHDVWCQGRKDLTKVCAVMACMQVEGLHARCAK